ncbi:unnamed protein product [Caenorhabditis brenneri]
MRLFVLFVLSVLLKRCIGGSGKKIKGTSKVEFGLYCPDKTNWEYRIKISGVDNPPPVISGKVTGHFGFRTLDNVFTTLGKVLYCVEDTCTTGGSWRPCGTPLFFTVKENKVTYNFFGINLKDRADDSVLEKLYAHHLEKECKTGDCSAIRDRVAVSCDLLNKKEIIDDCNQNFEKTLKFFLENRPTSSPPPISISTDATTGESSNKTIFIVIGSVVGVVLLISLVVTYFICKRKKKNKQTGSGMTGTGTGSNTMTKSGATKQGTTTGTFQKTGTVGTGNTGNTTTGGQRY